MGDLVVARLNQHERRNREECNAEAPERRVRAPLGLSRG
jgi:hypothetical protein